jgi:hypothetical protein
MSIQLQGFLFSKSPKLLQNGEFFEDELLHLVSYKVGNYNFFLFHQEFPILLDFKHSPFCRIL